MSKKGLQKRRRKLYHNNPYCPRCGILMILPEDLTDYGPKMKNLPENMCTIEHTFSRLDALRQQPFPNSILCNKCNNEVGKLDEKNIGLNELRIRSNRLGLQTINNQKNE